MPAVDWRLLKAQCYTESHFVERAVSPVGAAGLCQFMPATWAETTRALRVSPTASIFDPSLSIQAAAFYMGKMRAVWKAPRPEYDRHSLALASYNGGAGNIIKAQRAAGGSNMWPPISAALPKITGKHAAETQNYVSRIWDSFRLLSLS